MWVDSNLYLLTKSTTTVFEPENRLTSSVELSLETSLFRSSETWADKALNSRHFLPDVKRLSAYDEARKQFAAELDFLWQSLCGKTNKQASKHREPAREAEMLCSLLHPHTSSCQPAATKTSTDIAISKHLSRSDSRCLSGADQRQPQCNSLICICSILP